jgi:hypothetical protein
MQGIQLGQSFLDEPYELSVRVEVDGMHSYVHVLKGLMVSTSVSMLGFGSNAKALAVVRFSWVGQAVYFLEFFYRVVRVHLGGGQAGMPQEFFYRVQVGAPLQ